MEASIFIAGRILRMDKVTVHTVSCTCCTASGQFSDGAGIQPVYTPFRSVLNKRRWRLGPPRGGFSMGWMPLL